MKIIKDPVVKLIWSTPDPRRVIALAARMTYSDIPVEKIEDELTEDEISKSVNAILERQHLSVLRHVSFMFTISGVSRAFSHQLVRHCVGNAYEQRSQHYRKEKDPAFIMPDGINISPNMRELYETMVKEASGNYDFLVKMDIPREDARFVLPNATETTMVWTANLEAIYNFVSKRACRVNTQEILRVAVAARQIVIKEIPEMAKYLGPPCWTMGMCFEGQKYYKVCNKPWKSPTVLWAPDFPDKITKIGFGEEDGND